MTTPVTIANLLNVAQQATDAQAERQAANVKLAAERSTTGSDAHVDATGSDSGPARPAT